MKKYILLVFSLVYFFIAYGTAEAILIVKTETRDVVGNYGAINPDSPYFPHTRITHPDSGTSDGMIRTTDVDAYPGAGLGDFKQVRTVTISAHDHDERTVVAIYVHSVDGTWSPIVTDYDVNTIGGDSLCGEDSTMYGLHRHPHNDDACYVNHTFTLNMSTDGILMKFSCAQSSGSCPRNDDIHIHIGNIVWDIEDTPTPTSTSTPIPTPTLNPIPNCWQLSGPTTLTVGQAGRYSAQFISAQGQLVGEIFRDEPESAGPSRNRIVPIQQIRFPLANTTGSVTTDWIPTQPGVYMLGCRAWNDSIAECRPPSLVDRVPRYPCAGPGYELRVTVNPANTPTAGPTATRTLTPTATIVPLTPTSTPVVLKTCNDLSGCTTGADCQSGFCYTNVTGLSFCRNASCPQDSDCSCFGGPTPTHVPMGTGYCPI